MKFAELLKLLDTWEDTNGDIIILALLEAAAEGDERALRRVQNNTETRDFLETVLDFGLVEWEAEQTMRSMLDG